MHPLRFYHGIVGVAFGKLLLSRNEASLRACWQGRREGHRIVMDDVAQTNKKNVCVLHVMAGYPKQPNDLENASSHCLFVIIRFVKFGTRVAHVGSL